MTKEYPYTFDTWRKGECSEPVSIEVTEEMTYQSLYVYKFNYLRDRGWRKVSGRWISPRPPHHTYGDIDRAFGSQKYYDEVRKDDS